LRREERGAKFMPAWFVYPPVGYTVAAVACIIVQGRMRMGQR
jgi:hypothetical protein